MATIINFLIKSVLVTLWSVMFIITLLPMVLVGIGIPFLWMVSVLILSDLRSDASILKNIKKPYKWKLRHVELRLRDDFRQEIIDKCEGR